MSNDVGRIFEQVIEGTGDQSRIDFEEHGVNQQTLEDMKQGWKEKLSSLGGARYPWDIDPVQQYSQAQYHQSHVQQQQQQQQQPAETMSPLITPQSGMSMPPPLQSPSLPVSQLPHRNSSASFTVSESSLPNDPTPVKSEFPSTLPFSAIPPHNSNAGTPAQQRAASALHQRYGAAAANQVQQLQTQSHTTTPTQSPSTPQNTQSAQSPSVPQSAQSAQPLSVPQSTPPTQLPSVPHNSQPIQPPSAPQNAQPPQPPSAPQNTQPIQIPSAPQNTQVSHQQQTPAQASAPDGTQDKQTTPVSTSTHPSSPTHKSLDSPQPNHTSSTPQNPSLIQSQTDGPSDALLEWKAEVSRRRAAALNNNGHSDRIIREYVKQRALEKEGNGELRPLTSRTASKKQTKRRDRGSLVASVPPGPLNSMPIPPHDGAGEDGIGDEEWGGDENAINSDLDDPEDEIDDDDDDEQQSRLMLCTYDKVQRIRTRWKCTLKDGIMSTNDKVYVFHKAQGEFEW